jgi:hypothetical protein
MVLKFRLNVLKGIFEHVDELRSKPSQCENKSELELKYVYLNRNVEHIMCFSMLIMNIIHTCYVLNEEL